MRKRSTVVAPAAAQPPDGAVNVAKLPFAWWIGEIGWLVLAVSSGFSGFFLTMAAVPLWATDHGASVGEAGLITTVMLAATVVTQTVVPRVMHGLGAGWALAAGLILLGAPGPLYLLSAHVAWLTLVSAVRGVGFAFVTVVSIALLARLVAEDRRARAIGVHGVAVNIPNLFAVPLGVALTGSGHFAGVAWLSASPALAALAAIPLARRTARGVSDSAEPTPRALREARGSIPAAAVLFATCICAIGLMTFLPIAAPSSGAAATALLVFGVCATATRWRIGVVAERVGLGRLFFASAVAVAAGTVAVGLSLRLDGGAFAATSAGGCALAGLGYGGIQTLSLMSSLRRVPPHAVAGASAIWNIAFDGGLGLGALIIGLVAAAAGMSATFVICAVALAAAAPITRIAAQPMAGSSLPAHER
jgi:predicted MFS family arabinose efflux permease